MKTIEQFREGEEKLDNRRQLIMNVVVILLAFIILIVLYKSSIRFLEHLYGHVANYLSVYQL